MKDKWYYIAIVTLTYSILLSIVAVYMLATGHNGPYTGEPWQVVLYISAFFSGLILISSIILSKDIGRLTT